MPGGDRTGPSGSGSRTGRGAGYCSGSDVPGYLNAIPGRGMGRGSFGSGYGRGTGRGRGWRNGYSATGMPGWQRGVSAYPPEPTAAEEKEMLQRESDALKRELEDIQERISTLDKARSQE